MEDIRIAEDTIKHLKDFIELEKASKKIVTETAKFKITTLAETMIKIAEENIKHLKGEKL